ncbi:MAG: AAA-like domain-containing protein, partial [Planktothrix sp.]
MNPPIRPIQIEEPEGQVPLNSPLYIERPPIETDCYQALIRPTALIRIKAPRQMGKSSLMHRILHYGTQQGYHTACLNFQLA